MKSDIKNLFSVKRSKFCKNVIGFFLVALAFLNLEIRSECVFWSRVMFGERCVESEKTQWGFIRSLSTLVLSLKKSKISKSGPLIELRKIL